jgi:protein-S-isoprenylcysteine O-methyltransferase Ste14
VLLIQLLGIVATFGAFGALLFIPAGRLDWLQAWMFLVAFGAFLAFFVVWTSRHDPGLLDERMRVGANTKGWDKIILFPYTLLLAGLLVVSGLDAGRFRSAPAPVALQALGWGGGLLAGSLIWWTISVNTFLSRTVRIQEERGQKVIREGPYARVRHPMYLGVIVLMLSIPLMLGSGWGMVPGALIGILFIVRTALEDRTLHEELPGYPEYADLVQYRLLPRVW